MKVYRLEPKRLIWTILSTTIVVTLFLFILNGLLTWTRSTYGGTGYYKEQRSNHKIIYVNLRPNDVNYVPKHSQEESVDDAAGMDFLESLKRLPNSTIADTISKVENGGGRKLQIKDQHSFRPLDDNSMIILYSAHYDKNQKTIKFVGLGRRIDELTILSNYVCEFQSLSNDFVTSQLKVYYRITTYYPWEGQLYDSYIYTCDSSSLEGHPTAVTIKHKSNIATTLEFDIEPQSNLPDQYQRIFSICVEPLTNNYGNTDLIKHFIAINKLLGAEHFYFYASDASPEVIDLLENLEFVTVYSWPLGVLSDQTHAYGQKAANAHCLYSHKYTDQYLAFIDIDEVVVPREGNSLQEMVEIMTKYHPTLGAAVLQSVLFPLEHASQTQVDKFAKEKSLLSMTHRKTVGKFDLYMWSKVIARTSGADIVDIHSVRQVYPGFEIVNATSGVIHHYRHYNHELAKDDVYEDKVLVKYQQDLIDLYKKLFTETD